jgi:UDP-2-acetamido-2-deoxy-ribo-hexuluronate aminotransferase
VHGQKVKHQHPLVGVNGRLDTLQAAILIEKLMIFLEECGLRRQVAERYNDLLKDIQCIRTPFLADGNESVYAQYTILSEDREGVSRKLKESGIPSVAYYAVPLHLQAAFSELSHKTGDFSSAETVASQCLSLPMHPYLTEHDINRVCEGLIAAVN